MAEHTLAILVKAVGTAQAAKNLKGVDAAVASIGARAGKGLRTAASNMLKLGAAAGAVGVGLGVIAVKGGVQSLATLETAVTSVDGAIKQMGQSGQITGANVASWANEIETSIGAAFDDKDITAATANLIRFGKVTPKNLRTAMVVMTDLAVKTGSVESASELLGKALADPIKATGKLSRYGIILTKTQQAQIKAFVKAGKTADAQAVILDALSASTTGAAAASQGPYARAMAIFSDVTEDAQRAISEGFLPVLTRAADWLRTKLGDPSTMSNIRTLGDNLASAFDKALDFVEGIDWNSLGQGLKVAADWAGKLFGAFMALPPEVKGTIIALAGLDKLSGGAISGIAGELGKGLIKGVLNMNAAVVNVNAAKVNGGGPDLGKSGGKGGGAPSGGGISGMLKTLGPLGVAAASMNDLKPDSAFGTFTKNQFKRTDYRAGVTDITSKTGEEGSRTRGRIDRSTQVTAMGAVATTSAATRAGMVAAMASLSSAGRIVGAIAANRPVVTTNVTVNVTAANVTASISKSERVGSGNGSSGGRGDRRGGP